MTGGLYVVAVISNPVRFASRYHLYRRFAEHMQASGADLLTVEVAFGDRPHAVTEAGNPMHVQLRTRDELWHKENMINLGIARLPADWQYVAWIDADLEFVRRDWVAETIEQLQHYRVVQMFQSAIDLGPDNQVLKTHRGFVWCWSDGLPHSTGYQDWHPGYAWGRAEMRSTTWVG